MWDWQRRILLYSRDLSEAPLFLSFSPAGSYLVYGVTEWKGLIFLDGATGNELPYFSSGFGIVSAVVISDSEKSIMTYSPSGEIDYWNIQTGALKQSYRTQANLSSISFTSNYRYMVGANGDQLTVIDLLSGGSVASTPLRGLDFAVVDQATNGIVCYAGADPSNPVGGAELSLWSFTTALYKQTGALITPDQPVTSLMVANGAAWASLSDGTIYTERPYSNGRMYGTNSLLGIDDFGVTSSSMLLSSEDRFLVFGSDFFGLSDPSRTTSLRFDLVPNPFSSAVGVTPLPDGRFALWRQDSNAYALYTPGIGLSPTYSISGASLVDLVPAGGEIATLDAAGRCSLIDPDTGAPLFTYASFGIKALASIDTNRLVAGQNRSAALSTSLLQINARTGETVPIPNDDMLVFRIAYARQTGQIYTLGIRSGSNSLETVLKTHDANTFAPGGSLMSYAGVDLGASLTVDPSNGDLYTTLGFRGVRRLGKLGGTADSLAYLERSDHIPRKLAIEKEWVVAVNTDSTLSVWDKATGRRVLDLYLFRDFTWLALLPDGNFYASPGAQRYVKGFQGYAEINNLDPYRIDLPGR